MEFKRQDYALAYVIRQTFSLKYFERDLTKDLDFLTGRYLLEESHIGPFEKVIKKFPWFENFLTKFGHDLLDSLPQTSNVEVKTLICHNMVPYYLADEYVGKIVENTMNPVCFYCHNSVCKLNFWGHKCRSCGRNGHESEKCTYEPTRWFIKNKMKLCERRIRRSTRRRMAREEKAYALALFNGLVIGLNGSI